LVTLRLWHYCDDTFCDFDRVDPDDSGRGNRAVGKIVDPFGPCGSIDRWRLLRDESAPSRLDRDGAGSRQSIVGVPNGVEINPQGDRDLSHGGHFFAWVEEARPNCPEHLVAYLHVDRNA
jgi:hypothetical protein